MVGTSPQQYGGVYTTPVGLATDGGSTPTFVTLHFATPSDGVSVALWQRLPVSSPPRLLALRMAASHLRTVNTNLPRHSGAGIGAIGVHLGPPAHGVEVRSKRPTIVYPRYTCSIGLSRDRAILVPLYNGSIE